MDKLKQDITLLAVVQGCRQVRIVILYLRAALKF